MEKVTGIKSVDFKITALGYGVVNWNGSTEVRTLVKDEWQNTKNHNMPKLRGYSNQILLKNEKGEDYFGAKKAIDLDFKKTPLYISQNCIRHHLFKGEYYNLQSPKLETNIINLLCSFTGLMRGYVIPKNENKRTSPLLLTDFVDQLGNGNFEQMGRSGSKIKEKTKSGKDKSKSFFSKTTFGDTRYAAYGSISIELLQFIPLAADFGRQAMIVNNDKEGENVAKKLEAYLKTLSNNGEIRAIYHNNYVRTGAIFNEGEQGILLNDAAVEALVNETLELLNNLSIRQAKGYMYVDSVLVDYNNGVGKNMLRIKQDESLIQSEKSENYAVYYEGN